MKQIKVRSLKYPEPHINWDFQAEDNEYQAKLDSILGREGLAHERTVEANSEPYTAEDVLEEIPAVMDGDEQLSPPMVRLRAQYTIEIEDLGNSLVLAELRHRRDALLAQTDWTQVNDAPLSSEQKAAYATYRQALRDLPANNANAQSLSEVQFPSKPE